MQQQICSSEHEASLYEQIVFWSLLGVVSFMLILVFITFWKYLQVRKNYSELIKEENALNDERIKEAENANPLKILDLLQKYLSSNIHRLYLQGTMAFMLTLSIGILMYSDIKTALSWQLTIVDNAKNPTQVLAYLLFRSSALGLIATTLIYFGARMTVASFDQAMRFTKRKLGTIFLEYLYAYHHQTLKKEVTLLQIMTSFEIWNKTVESAFSNIKTERGDNLLAQNLKELAKEKEKEDKKEKNSKSEEES